MSPEGEQVGRMTADNGHVDADRSQRSGVLAESKRERPAWLEFLRRRRTPVAWAVFVAVFATSIALFGIPYSEDTIVLWLTAALFVASLGDLGRWGRGVLRDWLPLYVVLIIYALLRGYASHVLWGPFVRPQVDFDKLIGFGTVPTVALQRWLFNPHHLMPWDYGVWVVYMSHFFVSFIVLGVLWKRNYRWFQRYAFLWVTLTLLGYVIYVLYPAMPPWLASQTGQLPPTTRIIPVVWNAVGVHGAAALFTGGNRFDNNIAAMPSLHAAYPMLLCLFSWRRVKRPWVRVVLVTYVFAMAFTLVYTGEHFVIDELVGWALAVAVYFIGTWSLDWRQTRRRLRVAEMAFSSIEEAQLDGPITETQPAGSARPAVDDPQRSDDPVRVGPHPDGSHAALAGREATGVPGDAEL
jgi:hypothetical protein